MQIGSPSRQRRELTIEDKQASAGPRARAAAYLPDLLILPLGAFLGAVGLCPRPDSNSDALAMLGLGIAGALSAPGGGVRLMRGIRRGVQPLQIVGALSLGSAALVGTVGWIYASEARNYIHYITHRFH
jgi:hypothetical protein